MYVQIKRNLSYSKLMNLWIDSSSDKKQLKELFKHDVLQIIDISSQIKYDIANG
jgi:hypothetical protein